VFLAAEQAAGVTAAKHRGDLAGAEQLLVAIGDEATRTRRFCPLAELALTLVRTQTGQCMDRLVQKLSLHLAAAAVSPDPAADTD
jgi:Fe-Mn family superoxide dismutase